MFVNSIDNKKIFTDQDGNQIVDLTKSIFGSQVSKGVVYSIYKVPKEMEMRVDLVSNAAYGSSEYAEMVLKYSDIPNPFAIEEGDLVIMPSLQTVYNDVATDVLENNNIVNNTDLVKKYHKYIDPDKAPNTIGSETNTTSMNKNGAENAGVNDSLSGQSSGGTSTNISGNSNTSGGSGSNNNAINSSGNEANISPNGSSGISIINGRIYFGDNVSTSSSNITDIEGTNTTDSSLVSCARNGVTLGQFLNATISNRNNRR